MGRAHLFEFNDQPWLPAFLRDAMTGYLETLSRKMKLHEPCEQDAALLEVALEVGLEVFHGSRSVVRGRGRPDRRDSNAPGRAPSSSTLASGSSRRLR